MAERSRQRLSRTRRSPAAWQELVGRWEGSGLTQVAFCRREGLVLATFRWWCRRLKGEETLALAPVAVNETREFVPIQISRAQPEGGMPLELAFPCGTVLRVPPGCDPQSLLEVLRALEEVRRC